jgi:hypothetical protein
MKNLIDKLNKTHTAYWSAIDNLESYLSDKIDFEFSIFEQPGDGFVIQYDSHNAPLDSCLRIIKCKGKLSLDDYMDKRI